MRRPRDNAFSIPPACTTTLCRLGFDQDHIPAVPVDEVAHVSLATDTPEGRSFVVPTLGLDIRASRGATGESWLRATKLGNFIGNRSAGCEQDATATAGGLRALDRAGFDAFLDSLPPTK